LGLYTMYFTRAGVTTCIFAVSLQWVAVLPEAVTRVTTVATTHLVHTYTW